MRVLHEDVIERIKRLGAAFTRVSYPSRPPDVATNR